MILDAAARLFVRDGYVPTTIERIAGEAGVAPSTVYATFGTKVGILAALRWRWVQAAGVPDVRQATDQGPGLDRRLALLVGLNRRIYESGIELLAVMRAAAAADPEAARDWQQWTAERRANIDGALSELQERSRDVVRALLAPDVFAELVQHGSWSPDEYERWLRDVLLTIVAGR